ncbi:glycoside hydrolase family 97 protein [Robertkochia solimangrovi]|uniref:glycoside hydrolase family 97 protein n=1 Tax=Robertkochia solimangrovi TaxID=2213046 RepID=UPI00117E9CCB|nr:glycoside hydrolase family 97 protein [Robertkochia solimangrovi]TRZ42294.1 glycoside hydrolase family 97 protein [Robertkochia solimangrovi]
MKKTLLSLFVFVGLVSCQQEEVNTVTATSPDGLNAVTFELIDGKPVYSVTHGDKSVIKPSALGFVFQDHDSLYSGLEVEDIVETEVDDEWEQVWGEKQFITDHYKQLEVALKEKKAPYRTVKLQFRAFNDGVAFRYLYPGNGSKDSLKIMDELTTFDLGSDGQAWWIPAYQDNRYEYLFTKSAISTLDTVHTPLTIESDNGLYVSFHEARLIDFASMTLAHTTGTTLKADLVPWADGVKVKTNGSFTTPWRTIQIGEKPGDLITSYMILNLNDPNELEDTSWIKPHKYLGIWWGMHIGKYSFWESPIQGATTSNSFKYIDYCKELGIDHLLIEGWNKGWTPQWYENHMHMFSFTENADNFDLKKVTDYARENGVSIIGYHETGSNIINYRKQINAGMQLYHDYGIHDVKIGQVGSRMNMKEWHHGQFGVAYYREVLKTAAQYQLTVNFHEPIKDTGERRTFPNMMAREGARGQEYNAWSEGNPPSHTVILPFTRMLAGPMDFTPGVLDVEIKQGYAGRDVHTTAAKQLALYVVLYSPIQMLADLPENYVGNPAFKFLQDVPTDWYDTKVLNAEIGAYITTVRKDRHSEDWYLGSITNEQERTLEVPLDFLEEGSVYEAQLYADAAGTGYETNPTAVTISTKEVTSKDSLTLNLGKSGGTAIRFAKK